jgi:hypothetical protein
MMLNQIQAMLEQLVATGKADRSVLELVQKAAADPNTMTVLLEKLSTIGGDIEEPLDIEDYYSDGDGSLYAQRWDISPYNPFARMGISFDSLDRKTQFFVLFGEWQRRETEGMMSLTNGDLAAAEDTFNECLARANQIDVNELRARSYEGLMRVAEKRDDRDEVLRCLEKIEEIRDLA